MMMGGGFLRQMNETIKYNRDLLGNKIKLIDKLKNKSRNRNVIYSQENEAYVKERLNLSIKRIGKQHFYYKLLSWLIAIPFLIFLIAGITKLVDKPKIFNTQTKGTILFTKKIQVISKETKLEIFYFSHGLRAEETYYQNGLKQFESTSYYESGEVFRKATYFQDTLVSENFFFKNGSSIESIPELTPNKVVSVSLINNTKDTLVMFKCFNKKIIEASYVVYEIPK
ncbi:MAG: hypothetical protein O9340_00280 [Cyclobacteriaceae bacterium]|nr:hypothetical protein [Cyclobacteriaceae bacterium]